MGSVTTKYQKQTQKLKYNLNDYCKNVLKAIPIEKIIIPITEKKESFLIELNEKYELITTQLMKSRTMILAKKAEKDYRIFTIKEFFDYYSRNDKLGRMGNLYLKWSMNLAGCKPTCICPTRDAGPYMPR